MIETDFPGNVTDCKPVVRFYLGEFLVGFQRFKPFASLWEWFHAAGATDRSARNAIHVKTLRETGEPQQKVKVDTPVWKFNFSNQE